VLIARLRLCRRVVKQPVRREVRVMGETPDIPESDGAILLVGRPELAREIRRELAGGGMDLPLAGVAGRAALGSALRARQWQAVLIEQSPPDFGGADLLGTRPTLPDHVPVLALVAGDNEHARHEAVGLMEAGRVQDVITLGRTPSRLPPALRREIRQAALSREHERTEKLLREHARDLGERVKELRCLYGISKLVEKSEAPPAEVIGGILELIPPAWQFPAITSARAIIMGETHATRGFSESPWRQTSEVFVGGERIGEVSVFYGTATPPADEGPFLIEERHLLDAVAERLGRIVQRKQAEARLEEHGRLLQQSERALKEFSGKILSIREEEKKKISNTLHDELGSMTVALTTQMSIIAERIRSGNTEEAADRVEQARGDVLHYVEQLKRLAKDLRPPNFDIVGLPGALGELVSSVRSEGGPRIEFTADPEDMSLPEEISIALYRTAQEGLNNALRHASPSEVRIELCAEDESARLTVTDDGRGFVLEEGLARGRIGLRGMMERVESLGGSFQVRASVGGGTALVAVVPLDMEDASP